MIGTKNRHYAREILQCGTTRAKVFWLGDSIMTIAGDGLQGMFPRIFNVAAFDGLETTGTSQYLLAVSSVTPDFGTPAQAINGSATTIPGFPGGKQNYTPGVGYEFKFNGVAVPAAANYLSNRAFTISLTGPTTGRENLRSPSLATSTRYGDVWKARLLAAGSLKLKVWFYAGPWWDDSARIFLQVTDGSAFTKDIAHSEPFNLYQAEAGFVERN